MIKTYHREVLPSCTGPRRFARIFAVAALVLGSAAAVRGCVGYEMGRRAWVATRIQRLEHDVHWCGQRLERLREQMRPVRFIAEAP